MINGLGVRRLGRRRYRSRSLHARPADLDAAAAGGRLQTARQAARRLHRHRPGADRHADAAQERRGRQVRRILRRRAERAEPGRPRHHRQHGARIRRDHGSSRWTTRRSTICASPIATRSWSTLVEAYSKEQGLFRTDDTPDPVFADTLELDLATVVPSMAGPKRPQDRVDLPDVKKNFRDAFEDAHEDSRRSRSNGEHVEIRRRRRGDRGHHQLHQHFESVGDDRRRAAREEGRGARV